MGYAKVAMQLALKQADDRHLYPRYLKDGTCRATHASAALGKWLKKDFGMTAHSLRHTFRDRLRASGCPLELIDQIAFQSLDQRLVFYLNEQFEARQSDTLQTTHQDIATDLNTRREVISRLLKKMEREGMVALARNTVRRGAALPV